MSEGNRQHRRRAEDEDSLLVSVDDSINVPIESLIDTATSNAVSVGWKFERLTTLPVALMLIVVNLIMIGLVFLIPGVCESSTSDSSNSCLVDPLSSLIYAHAIYWTVHLVADQYLKSRHKISRCRGYIEFYLNTKNLRRTPFYMVSIGNAVLLLTVTALHDYCDHENNCPDKFTKVDYLRGLITLECMTIACIWVSYILNVREFHKKANKPDVYRDEFVQMVCPENSSVVDGPTEPTTQDVLEKQAELIRCMHEYVTRLNEKMSATISLAATSQAQNHHL